MPFAATFAISSIDGTNGFRIHGGSNYDRVGQLLSSVGDINGDGFDDFISGAWSVDARGRHQAGSAWVIFGTASGLPTDWQVSAVNGVNGFRIDGEGYQTRLGTSVGGGSDVNGDGIDDLILGSPGGSGAGAAYVIFGHTGPFANVDTQNMSASVGIQLNGGTNARAGMGVAGVGDVNGDGVGDFVVGGYGANSNAGVAYVVFGGGAGLTDGFDLSTLNGTTGFKIQGTANSRLGEAVAAAGDVNGDGIDDLIVGAAANFSNTPGQAYVIFGANSFAATLDVATLNGANGFAIQGAVNNSQTGHTVVGLGDVNGDGYDDVAVSSNSVFNMMTFTNTPGGVSIVFGSGAAFPATLAISALNGTNGFRLTGSSSLGGADGVSGGDVNGDGLADILVNAGGSTNYVIYGRQTAFGATFDVTTLDGSNGFGINGEGYTIAGAGDFNNDGADDIVIGNFNEYIYGNGTGGAYLIYGISININYSGTGGNDTQAGDVGNDTLNGNDGDDTLSGAAGADALNGGSGADSLDGGDGNDILNGGIGADLMAGGAGSDRYYVDDAGDGVTEGVGGGSDTVFSTISFILGANIEHLTLLGSDNLDGTGNSQANTLTGNDGDNLLDGGDNADKLYGGLGADDLIGGLGGDTLFGEGGVDELSGGDGADKLYGGTGADQLNGGTGNDRMDGESDVDTLNGGAGNDYLDGGLGADIMSGGTENDVYIVDDAGDQTIEQVGQGSDIVRTSINWVLADNIETLELQSATNASGTGNSGANNLQGNSGANTLSGLAGVDTINGNDGDDTVIGGQGNDLLRGGLGQDTFRVEHAFSGALETDQIYDFQTAEGDIMDFSALFAGTIARVTSFTGVAGQMTLTFAAGITTVRLDIDGNGVAEYQAKINGDVTGDYGGWLL